MLRLFVRKRSRSNTKSLYVICAMIEFVKPFVPKRKVSKLKEDATRVDFENEFQRLARAGGQITSDEDIWKSIKEDFLA